MYTHSQCSVSDNLRGGGGAVVYIYEVTIYK